MKRLGLLLVIVVLFAAVWRQLDRISLVVIGQPSSSGTIQRYGKWVVRIAVIWSRVRYVTPALKSPSTRTPSSSS
jgi:hypothetical protein